MRNGASPHDWKIAPLLDEVRIAMASPDPGEIRLSNPSLVMLQSGRMLLSIDQVGPGVKNLPGKKGNEPGSSRRVQGVILGSGDAGVHWAEKDRFPFAHSRLFRDGHGLYVVGHTGAVQLIKSTNGGETWGKPAPLTKGGETGYTIGPANVCVAEADLLAVFMQNTAPDQRGDPASVLAPVVWRADPGGPLTDPRAWRRSEPCLPFRRMIPYDAQDLFGVPFFPVPKANQGAQIDKRRWAFRTGWKDTHVLQIRDPSHAWHDSDGQTFHLLSTAHTHRTGLAVLSTLTQEPDGKFRVGFQPTPAGTRWTFVPVPGGHLRFSIFYDDVSRRFWLVSAQSTDSLSRPGHLGKGRRGLPCDETHRWQLSFSRNLIDWCFAGCLLADTPAKTRFSDPAAVVHGNDLHVAFRRQSWAADARSDEIICGGIPNFRDLVY